MVLHRKDPRHWNWIKSTLTNVMDLIIDVFALVYLSSRILGFSYLRSFLCSWPLYFSFLFLSEFIFMDPKVLGFYWYSPLDEGCDGVVTEFLALCFLPVVYIYGGYFLFLPLPCIQFVCAFFHCFIFFHYPCRYILFFQSYSVFLLLAGQLFRVPCQNRGQWFHL